MIATHAKPMSDKQAAFLRTLYAQAFGENGPEAMLAWEEAFPHGPSAAHASTRITEMLTLVKKAPKAAVPTGEIPDGLHMVNGVVIRVRHSKGGHQYGERLLTDAERVVEGTTWLYEGRKALKGASTATLLTLEQAKAYGKSYGVCAACGALLEDPVSVEAGIGPVCAKKF